MTLTSSSQLPLDHPSELDGTRLNAAFDYLENVAKDKGYADIDWFEYKTK